SSPTCSAARPGPRSSGGRRSATGTSRSRTTRTSTSRWSRRPPSTRDRQAPMRLETRARYTEADIAEAARRYGATADALVDLDGFEAPGYAIDRPDGRVILRLTEDSHRPLAQVEAELDFVEPLHAAGVRVARPIPSPTGHLCEHVNDHITA